MKNSKFLPLACLVIFTACSKDQPLDIPSKNNLKASDDVSMFYEGLQNDLDNLDSKDNILLSNADPNNSNNPFNGRGVEYAAMLDYLSDFAEDIMDENVYCPIRFSEDGTKSYDTNVKITNRIQKYAIDNNLNTLSDSDYSNALSDINDLGGDLGGSLNAMNTAVSNNEMAAVVRDLIIDYNIDLSEASDINELIAISKTYENNVVNSSGIFTASEEELLLTIMSATQHGASLMQGKSGSGIVPVAFYPEIGSLPCGWAAALYVCSFVGLCAATGGLGIGLGLIGMGGAIAGVMEGC